MCDETHEFKSEIIFYVRNSYTKRRTSCYYSSTSEAIYARPRYRDLSWLHSNPVAVKISFWKALDRVKESQASGDSGVYCAVCDRTCSPRRMRDSCQLSGREVTYDQLVRECFCINISVPEHLEAKICSPCVKQLRESSKFKQKLVTAFKKPKQSPSDSSYYTGSSTGQIHKKGADSTEIELTDMAELETGSEKTVVQIQSHEEPTVDINNLTNKEILKILNKKLYVNPKKEKKVVEVKKVATKKMIVRCCDCGQRYPMIFRSDMIPQDYVCSRCKLKKPFTNSPVCRSRKSIVPTRQIKENPGDRGDRFAKNDLKGQLVRMRHSSNNPQVKSSANLSRHLSNVEQQVKKTSLNAYRVLCKVCGKNAGSKKKLEQHVQMHQNEEHYDIPRFKPIFQRYGITQHSLILHR